MINLAEFDEMNNAVREGLELSAYTDADGNRRFRQSPSEICDAILDYLIYAYVMGVQSANDDMGSNVSANTEQMDEAIYADIAGKNWEQRITEYAEQGDVESIMRVVDTEMHRDASEGADNTARKAGATKKTWQTMEDDRVRDPHWWLQGVTVGIDEKFATDGAEASYPGDFGVAYLDVGCRCFLKYT